MAIEKFIEGAAQRIADAVGGFGPDVAGLRQGLVRRADASLGAIGDGSFADPWLAVADERTIAFSPATADGQPLLVNGKTTTFYPRDAAAGAVTAFRAAVEDGAFDDQLASGGAPTVSPRIEGEQVPADPENGSMTTGGGRTDADEVATRHTEHAGAGTERGDPA